MGKKACPHVAFDDIATDAGESIDRALATPVEIRKGTAFFAFC